jgi:hypothetical protein
MQTLTCTIDTTTGALRFDRPLYLGATYGVTTSGATARVVLCDCNGDPVAASDPESLSGHVFALDTAELLALFRRAGIAGSPGCVVVHAWCYDTESGDAIAQSDIPVFYSPLVDADGVLTKIDTKGAKGDKGEPGKSGPNFVTFHIDENGILVATANSPLDLYHEGDENKPRWKLGDGTDGTTAGHLYYVIYDDGDARHLDVGTVKGADGDTGATGNGIDHVEYVGTDEDGATYRLFFTNGTHYDFLAPRGPDATAAIRQAMADIDAPGAGATQKDIRMTLTSVITALKGVGAAVALAMLSMLSANAGTIPWEEVPPDTPVDTNAITRTAEAVVEISASDAARGVTFVDEDGIDQNAAIEIGRNAKAAPEAGVVGAAPDNAVVRSASIAIGDNADATDPGNPLKQQAIAIGWNAQAKSLNAIAIGDGAQHTNETPMTGHATVATGPKAIAAGYAAKATEEDGIALGAFARSLETGAVQIGSGTNETPNSLKFRDTFIVKDGKIAGGTDTNEVARMISETVDQGVAFINSGRTNGYDYVQMRDVDGGVSYTVAFQEESETVDFPFSPGSTNRAEVYKAATVDAKLTSATGELARAWSTDTALLSMLLHGSNVVAEVTNYNSQVRSPSLRLLQLNESNEYETVWNEMTNLSKVLHDATNHADTVAAGALNASTNYAAPRAWSRTTSGLGAEAPEGWTWISTPYTALGGGLEFEKHITTGGAIWILKNNGMVAQMNALTNNTAYLEISSLDGESVFRIEKTDAQLLGVDTTSVSVEGDALICGVNVVSAEHPYVRVRTSLTQGDWAREEDGIPASLATVQWSGESGAWVCEITNTSGSRSLFATMQVLQEGGTKIVPAAPMDASAGILCTDGHTRVRPVNTNGTITWEIIQ